MYDDDYSKDGVGSITTLDMTEKDKKKARQRKKLPFGFGFSEPKDVEGKSS
jgi:hypothetical protein